MKQIIFPRVNEAELVDVPEDVVGPRSVKIKTMVSTVSAGTERANITGDANVAGANAPDVTFPRRSGYSISGIAVEVGSEVKDIKVGDRVHAFWTRHKEYNCETKDRVLKIPDGISFSEAAQVFISTFSLAAIRKCRLEIGESAMVMGLGLLGQYAVKLLRCAGAVPIIAVDPIESKRKTALASGADYALNPFEEGFADKVKALTGGGVNVCIEVTGLGSGLDMALDCMAKFGRVALLGCTRNKNFSIDYYRKVHSPGISLIGAHTMARPDIESHPGYFTHRDDITSVFKLLTSGRLSFDSLGAQLHSPHECPAVYERLINDKNFPAVVQFDWERL